MLTTDVENYPGFPEGVTGPEMMDLFRKQAERFGSEIVYADATEVVLDGRPFRVKTAKETYLADALIVATGAAAKWLGLESEKKLQNRGVSACATCDGALYRGKEIGVVGGGDTAMEEALFLTPEQGDCRSSASSGRRKLRLQERRSTWASEVIEVLGDKDVEGIRVQNRTTGEKTEIPLGALFVAIGHEPRSDLFRGKLEVDDQGYIRVQGGTRTSVEGVFACGDVMDKVYRQAVTAAGTGCMAAIDAERFLAEHESDTSSTAVSEARA
jgi:thioredoxin reductase (NADPH)